MSGSSVPSFRTQFKQVQPAALRVAFLERWLAMNSKAAGHLPANGYAARMVDGADQKNIIEAEKTIAGFNTILTLKSLEGVFEADIGLSHKNVKTLSTRRNI